MAAKVHRRTSKKEPPVDCIQLSCDTGTKAKISGTEYCANISYSYNKNKCSSFMGNVMSCISHS